MTTTALRWNPIAAHPPEIPGLIGASPTMQLLRRNLEVIARSDGAVVISGESGTGKELVARAIHQASARRLRPMITVNCAAFPEALLEAELYGHERGAFTGAAARREGRFEAASGGTLFLDEIAEMPLLAQAKLLRVLQEGTLQRLGSNTTIKVDVRLLSATNRNLEQLVAQGRFREDLFYRIKLFRVAVPALRAHRSDVGMLADHFCDKYAAPGGPRPRLSRAARARLEAHHFPGNVRELEHAIQHAIAFADGDTLEVHHLPEELAGDGAALPEGAPASTASRPQSLTAAVLEFEHAFLLQALERTEGNRALAASQLGISRKALWAKLKRYRAAGAPDQLESVGALDAPRLSQCVAVQP